MRPTRITLALVAAAGWWMVSCRDIPAPEGGVFSISGVLLPSPALVVGDTMRDSTGVVAPLRVTAFGDDGDPLDPQPQATFVVLDTLAHLDESGTLLIAGNATGKVDLVGGAGGFQSRPVTVKITLSPDALVSADSVLHHHLYSFTDTIINSAELATRVIHQGATETGVEGVIVQYAITAMPPGNGTGPVVVLVNGNTLSGRDTTDATGRASRTPRLRLAAVTGATDDTVAIQATASYRGQSIGTVDFQVVFSRNQ